LRPENTTAAPIRIAIVEDDDVVRESLAVLIGGASGFACVGTFPTAEQALEKLPPERPDVVLMDIKLPKMSGVECTRALKQLLPEAQVVMLTVYDDDMIFDAIRAGASGYLLKRERHTKILAAIEDVHQGGSPMTSSIARKVIQSVRQEHAAALPAPSGLASLSPRENEILSYLAKGSRYKEIANQLGIKLETVRTHLRRIYEKLHVSSRTEAAGKFWRR
jgi:DNA-binding NarL/FixJ family response regulator